MNFVKAVLSGSILVINFATNCMEHFPKKLSEICNEADVDIKTSYSCKTLQAIFECANARSPVAKEYCERRLNIYKDSIAECENDCLNELLCRHVGQITRNLSVLEGAGLLEKTKRRFEKLSSETCKCDHF